MINFLQYFSYVNKSYSGVYTTLIWVVLFILCSGPHKFRGVISVQNTGKIDISTIDHYRLLSVENLLSLSVQNAVIPDVDCSIR